MNRLKNSFLAVALVAVLFAAFGCDRTAVGGSKLSADNYNKVSMGMSKSQVETILGTPRTAETTDMLIFKKTTYRYEDGTKFAMITFKNDEVDGKDGNLSQ